MKKCICIVLSVFLMTVLTACGNSGIGPNGKTNVKFWGVGDTTEFEVFTKLVNDFNNQSEDIYINYTPIPADNYNSVTSSKLGTRSDGPDLCYVEDRRVKQWAQLGLITPLDEYISESTEFVLDEVWPSAIKRYRFDIKTKESSDTAPIYAVPKDISPTVIFYNKDALAAVGVTIISDKSVNRGYNPETKTFNNKVAMTWEDSVELFKLSTKSYNPNSITDYGYFTEWWFSYGWSVGGDCIEFVPSDNPQYTGGYWEFTLGKKTKNYIKDGVFVPEGTDGAVQLQASQFDAFSHFVNLSQAKNKGGLAVTPTPTVLISTSKEAMFLDQKVAMLVNYRWTTTLLRQYAEFGWDVAPLPKAADGIEAGHSGSMGLAISRRSKVKDAAWKFAEYIAGRTGQAEQAKTGYNIPNQIDLANSDVFLQPGKDPVNAEIFIDAAGYQKAGDWNYLPESTWIDNWAITLNSDVRNGSMDIDTFFNTVTGKTNIALKQFTRA